MDCCHFIPRRARVLGFAAAILFDLAAGYVVDLALGFFTIFFATGLATALAAGIFLEAASSLAFV